MATLCKGLPVPECPEPTYRHLWDLPIPLPPLAEQKRIVGVLNEQMAAVERAKKAAAERLEAAQALREAHAGESVFVIGPISLQDYHRLWPSGSTGKSWRD